MENVPSPHLGARTRPKDHPTGRKTRKSPISLKQTVGSDFIFSLDWVAFSLSLDTHEPIPNFIQTDFRQSRQIFVWIGLITWFLDIGCHEKH